MKITNLMRKYKIGDDVLISSYLWKTLKTDQLIYGTIIDIKKECLLYTKYIVKYKFEDEIQYARLSSTNIFTDKTSDIKIQKNNNYVFIEGYTQVEI